QQVWHQLLEDSQHRGENRLSQFQQCRKQRLQRSKQVQRELDQHSEQRLDLLERRQQELSKNASELREELDQRLNQRRQSPQRLDQERAELLDQRRKNRLQLLDRTDHDVSEGPSEFLERGTDGLEHRSQRRQCRRKNVGNHGRKCREYRHCGNERVCERVHQPGQRRPEIGQGPQAAFENLGEPAQQ